MSSLPRSSRGSSSGRTTTARRVRRRRSGSTTASPRSGRLGSMSTASSVTRTRYRRRGRPAHVPPGRARARDADRGVVVARAGCRRGDARAIRAPVDPRGRGQLNVESIDPLAIADELREVHRSALGVGALSDEWSNREPCPRTWHVATSSSSSRARAGTLVGFGYGYTGEHGQWWTDAVARALSSAQRERWLDPPHFEVVELHVRPSRQRQRDRQRAPRAAPLAAAARSRAALDPDRLGEGARLLREERLDGACGRRLRRRLPRLPRARQAASVAGDQAPDGARGKDREDRIDRHAKARVGREAA